MHALEKRERTLVAGYSVSAAIEQLLLTSGRDVDDDTTAEWVASEVGDEAKELNALHAVLNSLASRTGLTAVMVANLYRARIADKAEA